MPFKSNHNADDCNHPIKPTSTLSIQEQRDAELDSLFPQDTFRQRVTWFFNACITPQ